MLHQTIICLGVLAFSYQAFCLPLTPTINSLHNEETKQGVQSHKQEVAHEDKMTPSPDDENGIQGLEEVMRKIQEMRKGHETDDLALIAAVIKNIKDNSEMIHSKQVSRESEEKRKLESVENLDEQNFREEEKKALMMIRELEDEMERLQKELDLTKQEYYKLREEKQNPGSGQDAQSPEEEELALVSQFQPTQQNAFLKESNRISDKKVKNAHPEKSQPILSSGNANEQDGEQTNMKTGYFLPFPDDRPKEIGHSTDVPLEQNPDKEHVVTKELQRLNGM